MTENNTEEKEKTDYKRKLVIEALANSCVVAEDAFMISLRRFFHRRKINTEEPLDIMLSALNSSNHRVIEGMDILGNEVKEGLSSELALIMPNRSAEIPKIGGARSITMNAIDMCISDMVKKFLYTTIPSNANREVIVFDSDEDKEEYYKERLNKLMEDGFSNAINSIVKHECNSEKWAAMAFFKNNLDYASESLIKHLGINPTAKGSIDYILKHFADVFSLKMTFEFGVLSISGDIELGYVDENDLYMDLSKEKSTLYLHDPARYGPGIFDDVISVASERVASQQGFEMLISRIINTAIVGRTKELTELMVEEFGTTPEENSMYIRGLFFEIDMISIRSFSRCKKALNTAFHFSQDMPVYKRMTTRHCCIEDVFNIDVVFSRERKNIESMVDSAVDQWESANLEMRVPNTIIEEGLEVTRAIEEMLEESPTRNPIERVVGGIIKAEEKMHGKKVKRIKVRDIMSFLATSNEVALRDLEQISDYYPDLSELAQDSIKIIKRLMIPEKGVM